MSETTPVSSSTMTNNGFNFNLSAQQILDLTDEIIKNSVALLNGVVAVPEGSRNWENTIEAFEEAYNFAPLYANIYFPSYVHTKKDVRDASNLGKKKIDEFRIDTCMREDLYKAIIAFKNTSPTLGKLEKRLLEKILLDFERNGLSLSSEKREKLKVIKKRISELSIKAQQCMNEENSKHTFTEAELDGVPADILQNFHRDENGKCIVTLKYPDYLPIQKHCKVEETRKRLETAYSSRCQEENTPILEELIKLRHEGAGLLGFPNHASYVLALRMAKTPQTAISFLDDLIEKLKCSLNRDVSKFLELKKEDADRNKVTFDGKINSWDYNFYLNKVLERDYQINDNEIKFYFPMEHVVEGLLKVYEELLGLKFKAVEGLSTWHPEVITYEVFDENDGSFVGQFYLDLFPRDGKFTHASAFPLRLSGRRTDGTWQFPISAMVCNFTKPTVNAPSYLKHDEVVTFFHEMGHVFHNLCSKSKYPRFGGMSVERDFVEAPSQMLENWCWEKEILTRISRHATTQSPLPSTLLDLMIKSRLANVGILNCRQLFFGKYDLFIHVNPNPGDLAKLYGEMKTEITKVQNTPGTNGAAAWGHIFGGYDATYYGYMWSEVFSCDMFEEFRKAGVMNKALGKKYREVILESGATQDGMDLIIQFLGRQPSNVPFLTQKAIL